MHPRFSRLLVLTALALLPIGCITINLPGGPPPPLVETVVYGDSGGKILMVSLDGVLRKMTRALFQCVLL